MWFGNQDSQNELSIDVSHPDYQGKEAFLDCKEAIQYIFNSTKCYDLMSTSCKVILLLRIFIYLILLTRFSQVIVFENTISFQLAFNALIEHGNG